MFKLIEYRELATSTTEPHPNNALGVGHLCFVVDDTHATKAELEAARVEVYSDVDVVDEGPLAGWLRVYVADPDGSSLDAAEVEYYDEGEREAYAAAYLASRRPLADIEAGL